MIIQFTVENFLSFKEPATLSLAASALKKNRPGPMRLFLSLKVRTSLC